MCNQCKFVKYVYNVDSVDWNALPNLSSVDDGSSRRILKGNGPLGDTRDTGDLPRASSAGSS